MRSSHLSHKVRIEPADNVALDNIHFPAREEHELAGKNPLDFIPISYKVVGLNRDIYLSNIYTDSYYPIVFAYIKDDEGIYQSRFFYFSRSHSVWRVAPVAGSLGAKYGLIKGSFGKGYGEFSCDLPPHFNLAMTQQFQEKLKSPQQWIKHPKIKILIEAFSESSGRVPDASDKFLQETASPLREKPFYHYEEGVDPTFVKDATVMQVLDRDNLPSSKFEKPFSFNNPFYNVHVRGGKIPNKLFICPSENGEYYFLFLETTLKENYETPDVATARKTAVNTPELFYFLLTVSKSQEDVNSFGVSAHPVNLGYLHVTPIMRENDVTSLVGSMHPIRALSNRFDHEDQTSTSAYLNTADYALQLPINHYFKIVQEEAKKIILEKMQPNLPTTSGSIEPEKEKKKKKSLLSSFSLLKKDKKKVKKESKKQSSKKPSKG